MWCPEAESNHRHGDFQSPALPTELSGHFRETYFSFSRNIKFHIMVGISGLEPPASRLSGVRSNQLSYTPMIKKWRRGWDSNPRGLAP